MCSELAPPPPPLKPRTTPRIRANSDAASLKPPARKTRSKTRKPKYLSLRLELSQHSSSQMTSTTPTNSDHHHQQLNLFPLHPENLVDQDKLLDTHDQDHNMAASFFSAADDGAATTLTGLLSSAVNLTNSSDEDNLSPSSLNYGEYSNEEGEHNELVRTAMRRNKERDGSTEEKWVCYSEVVEEVSSSSACAAAGKPRRWKGSKNQTAEAVVVQQQRRLSLKLDYDEIMNAWSDKGPLYINHNNNSAMGQMDSPQTVPDLLHDTDFFSCSSAVNNGLWRVPEMSETTGDGKAPPCEWRAGGVGQQSQREASVQRYKEKRQNRLFAKKIRYQVRKLNAEKRPRIKGRFVKRS